MQVAFSVLDMLISFLSTLPSDYPTCLNTGIARSKFSTTVTSCTGNVLVGDNAVLTVGAPPAEGKKVRISQELVFWSNVSLIVP